MQPRTIPVPWEVFRKTAAPFSLALDGFVPEGPEFDPSVPVMNLNHHDGVKRIETRATCAQVEMRLVLKLFRTFRDKDGPRMVVCANDCDEDVCTSWFQLKHHAMCSQVFNPLLHRLISIEDKMDTTAGAYPYPEGLDVLEELAWVFEPYRRFRASGELDRREAEAFVAVVTDVEHRIMRHITGRGGRLKLDTRFDRMRSGTGWTMVREHGAQARQGVFGSGIDAFVAVRERPDGRYVYTFGRLSDTIPFPLVRLIDRLNREEDCTLDRWGGGDIVMGSPRVGGSNTNPDHLFEIVEDELKQVT
jgi:hypothetical protein